MQKQSKRSMTDTKAIVRSLEKEKSLHDGYATLAGVWVFTAILMDLIVFPIDLIVRIVIAFLLIATLACLHRIKDALIRRIEKNRNTGYLVNRKVWRRRCGQLAAVLYLPFVLVIYANQVLPTWLRAAVAGIMTILLFRLRLSLLVRKESKDKPVIK